MFESQEETPWYGSSAGMIGASLIFPPLGLALLWMKRSVPLARKVLVRLLSFASQLATYLQTWRWPRRHIMVEQYRQRAQTILSDQAQ